MIEIKHFKEAWIVKWVEEKEMMGTNYKVSCQVWVASEEKATKLTMYLSKEGIDNWTEKP